MDIVLLFVVYVLMSVVIQPSWLPNSIKVIIIITWPDQRCWPCVGSGRIMEFVTGEVGFGRAVLMFNFSGIVLW